MGSMESATAAVSSPIGTSDSRDQKETAEAVSTDVKSGRLGCTEIDHTASPVESGPARERTKHVINSATKR